MVIARSSPTVDVLPTSYTSCALFCTLPRALACASASTFGHRYMLNLCYVDLRVLLTAEGLYMTSAAIV